jgi:DNA-nicking Smr family endonuclease
VRGTAATDDAETYRRYLAGTSPLPDKPGRIPRTASKLERASTTRDQIRSDDERDDAEARARLRALVDGTAPFEVFDDGARLEGRRLDSDAKLMRRLRRGEIVVEGRLDLHRMTVEQARRAVVAFVAARRAAKERVVLIVHGKGEHSPGQLGILRGEIGAWLSDGPAAVHVACFATAQPEHGGSGAVYVALKP